MAPSPIGRLGSTAQFRDLHLRVETELLLGLRLRGRSGFVFPNLGQRVAVHLAAIVLGQRVPENNVLGHLGGGQAGTTMVEHVVDREPAADLRRDVEYDLLAVNAVAQKQENILHQKQRSLEQPRGCWGLVEKQW